MKCGFCKTDTPELGYVPTKIAGTNALVVHCMSCRAILGVVNAENLGVANAT